jgi:hypothetical protein
MFILSSMTLFDKGADTTQINRVELVTPTNLSSRGFTKIKIGLRVTLAQGNI